MQLIRYRLIGRRQSRKLTLNVILPVLVEALTSGAMDSSADPAIEDDGRALGVRDDGGTVVPLNNRLSEKQDEEAEALLKEIRESKGSEVLSDAWLVPAFHGWLKGVEELFRVRVSSEGSSANSY